MSTSQDKERLLVSKNKKVFYWKRDCIKINKHAKRFLANKGYRLVTTVFCTNFAVIRVKKFFVHFSNVICTKTKHWTPQLFISIFTPIEINGKVYSPWGPVFPTCQFFRLSVFLSSPWSVSRSDFQAISINIDKKYQHVKEKYQIKICV